MPFTEGWAVITEKILPDIRSTYISKLLACQPDDAATMARLQGMVALTVHLPQIISSAGVTPPLVGDAQAAESWSGYDN